MDFSFDCMECDMNIRFFSGLYFESMNVQLLFAKLMNVRFNGLESLIANGRRKWEFHNVTSFFQENR